MIKIEHNSIKYIYLIVSQFTQKQQYTNLFSFHDTDVIKLEKLSTKQRKVQVKKNVFDKFII
jgi:hypothetical protein